MVRNFLKSSIKDAIWNIILQISFRLVTFGLNGYVVRTVSQDVIGVMYVRLLLLESTILFLSREAFRKACLSKTAEHNWPKVINLVWLTVPLSITLSIIFGYIWLYVLTPPSPNVTQHYGFGVIAILITCVMEMCCEQLYLVSQAFLFLKLRIFAEVFSMMTRTITFVLLLTPENAVFAFSVAQIISITVYVSIFYGYFMYYFRQPKTEAQSRDGRRGSVVEFPFHSISDFGPKYLEHQEQLDYKLLVLVRNFLKQGVLMQILTEGERYVMTLFNVLSFAEQGVFDVVNNLGSLTARFLFRPIESTAFFYFSQLIDRNVEISRQNKKSMYEAAKALEYLLRGVSTLGLLILCFGQSYAQLVLFLYGGQTFATGLGPKLLRTHCLAVLLMAVNGTTEGYLLSTINAEDLNRHNKLMVVFSATFLFVAWILSYTFGSVGFILANCCNMSLRIFYSIRFIKRRYENTNFVPLDGLLPKKCFSIVLAISTVVTQLSEMYLFPDSAWLHFLIGAVCFCGTVITWYFQEQKLINFLKEHYSRKEQ